MSGQDDQGISSIWLYFDTPGGGTKRFYCDLNGVTSGSCSITRTFGTGDDFSAAGTYTYSHMNAQDVWNTYTAGSYAGKAYENNPFNVPDLVVLGN